MATIPVSDLTALGTDGTGVFDQLMEAVNKLLTEQYERGRIRGTDYANVYLGSMQWAMQQAVTFLLNRQKAELEPDLIQAQIDQLNKTLDKLDAEIALLWQKKITEQWETEDRGNPVDPRDAEETQYPTTTAKGVIGSEKAVRDQQIKSYKRDAEQKLAKMLLDQRAVEESVGTTVPLFVDADLRKMLDSFATQLDPSYPDLPNT